MSQICREGELLLSFPEEAAVERLDDQSRRRPEGMKLVDWVVERAEDVLLVEVKDYAARAAAIPHELVSSQLVPKVRDSYCFLHLMRRDSKPFRYFVLLELPKGLNAALLGRLNDQLAGLLRHEAHEEWKREYIAGAAIMTLEQWNKHFPEDPARRDPA